MIRWNRLLDVTASAAVLVLSGVVRRDGISAAGQATMPPFQEER